MSSPSGAEPQTNANAPPSPWVKRFAAQLPAGSKVLDLACGTGRHTRLLAALGHHVTAVDRDLSRVGDLDASRRVSLLKIDLEAEPWPFAPATYDAIVVTNYLILLIVTRNLS